MRLLSSGPVQTRMHEEDGNTIFERVQDCTPIADQCKALHNEGIHGSGEMRHAGRIPAVLVEKYINDNGITYREFIGSEDHIRRVMNDPAMAHFRVWKGRL